MQRGSAASRCRRTTSRSSTRSTRSSSTRPARRSSSRAGPTDAAELYYQFARIVRGLQRERDYEVDEAKRTVVPTEEGIGRVEDALGVENLYDARQPELRAPAPAGAARQGALQARRRLLVQTRRGEDRRRVHRSHPRRPPLERRSAPGGRGQGRREDQGGEPDPRDGHAAELLPHVREALGHDRHRVHRGRRVRAHLRPARSSRSRRTSRWSAPTTPTSSTRPKTRSTTPRSTTSPSATRRASRCSSAPSRSRSRRSSRELLEKRGIPHEVLNAKQHEREAEIIAQAGQLSARHRRDEHGRPRRRHPPRRQSRGPGAPRVHEGRARRRARPSTKRATPSCLPRFQAESQGRGRQGARHRRPLRARHRTPRVAPHRQPAAWPRRPPGRPRREPLLPVARRRADAPVRDRSHAAGDGHVVPRRRSARVEDGLEGGRARAGHRRRPQLRDPQGRAQVRRGDERAAQDHLPAPPADPRR